MHYYMPVVDAYRLAVKEAKEKVKEKFNLEHDQYHNDHPAHDYWLECYDRAFARLILRGE